MHTRRYADTNTPYSSTYSARDLMASN